MSYIQGTNPSFSQAVISFWCKVPQAALDAAYKEYEDWWDTHGRDDPPTNPPPLLGLVPLVVFGQEGTSSVTSESDGESGGETTSTSVTQCVEYAGDSYDGVTLNMWAWSECTGPTTQTRPIPKSNFSYEPKPGKPTNPSFIAVDRTGNLQINFESTQTGDVVLADVITSATSKYTTQEVINECYTFPVIGYCGDFEDSYSLLPGLNGVLEMLLTLIAWRLSTAVADMVIDQGSSPREEHKSERKYGSPPGDAGTGALRVGPTDIRADRWHHILVSVDMSEGSASVGRAAGDFSSPDADHFTKTSTMHVAVNDKNYKTGSYPFRNTNKVYTGSAAAIAGSHQAVDVDDDGNRTPQGPIPSYSLGGMSVPEGVMGMPAPGKYVDHVYHCEMAEFQMFVGKTLDTDKEENRRAFLDYKRDANGNPVPDNDGKVRLKPVKPDVAEKLLGKPPILMHGANKWIKGTNLGSGGAFKPTGEIKKYKPDPAVLPR
jgi:hypothetical protein